MAKHRKEGNEYTTISIRWTDKERLRKMAKFVKKTKNGDLYQSDAVIFNRLLNNYGTIISINDNTPHNTYPIKKHIVVDTSPNISQPDSSV